VPIVSVGVPVYNGEPFLEDSLLSLLDQDLTDIEVVVSDNGSTDRTESMCRDLASRDERLRYVRSEVNRGAAWNYNRVLELARSPLFKWAAADDICAPSFLNRCVRQLDEGGDAVVIAFPQTTLIDERGRQIGPLDDEDLMLTSGDAIERLDVLLRHRVEWHPVFGVMRTAVLRETRAIGSFPLADVALLAEMALRGRFHQVPARLFLRRYHEGRSIAAGPSFLQQVAWYDPRRRSRFAMPQTRLTYELLGAVARAPLSPADRLRGAAAVLRRWTLPHWRHIGGEAKLVLRNAGGGRGR
jgi:glycosyltransferase involved in cell wall biosynthesis